MTIKIRFKQLFISLLLVAQSTQAIYIEPEYDASMERVDYIVEDKDPNFKSAEEAEMSTEESLEDSGEPENVPVKPKHRRYAGRSRYNPDRGTPTYKF